jgi:hypothetical protein
LDNRQRHVARDPLLECRPFRCQRTAEHFNEARRAKRYPDHRKRREIIAKLVIIGRVYAAAIERGSPEGADNLYIEKIGPAMQRSRLDILLSRLPDGRSTWSGRLTAAVEVHSALMKIWEKAGAKGKRSLASKYLHFHRPDVFPLFDRRADIGIRRVTPDARHAPALAAKGADEKYKNFCRRYLWLFDFVRDKLDSVLSLRQADRLLLNIAKERPRAARRRPIKRRGTRTAFAD